MDSDLHRNDASKKHQTVYETNKPKQNSRRLGLTCSLDFTDESRVTDFFTKTGKIDHLVVAAVGVPAWGAFLELDSEEYHNIQSRE